MEGGESLKGRVLEAGRGKYWQFEIFNLVFVNKNEKDR